MKLPLEIGAIVADKYRVERVLAKGGMGVVYVAEHLGLHERFAIKVLRHDVREEQGSDERMLREARAAVRIKSDHVVRVFDVDVLEDGTPYLVMELLHGEDLEQIIERDAPLPIATAVDWVMEACDAVAVAHALGVVHGDLKPANVFLAKKPKGGAIIKVLDFGLARAVLHDPSEAGELRGSPLYMAPEQIDGDARIDARADVWALGAILFELLVGVTPFVAPSLGALFKLVRKRPTPHLRDARADAPPELQAVIERCLAKDRDARFADADELRAALAPFGSRKLEHAPSPTPGPSMLPRRAPATTGEWRIVRVAFVVVATAALFGLVGLLWRVSSAPARASSIDAGAPAKPRAKIACVPFRPGGQLGAAAAALACLRAQLRMGGRTDTTLVPAELLDLPREPIDGFPIAPFDAPGARDRAIAAARARGARVLDGDVARVGNDMVVSMSIERDDGTTIVAKEGRGGSLFEAVRASMREIDASGAIPLATKDDAFLIDWYRVRGGDAAERLLDLTIPFTEEDERACVIECKTATSIADVLPDTARAARKLCNICEHADEPLPPRPSLDPTRPVDLAALVLLDDLEVVRDPDLWRSRHDALLAARASVEPSEARALIASRAAAAALDAGDPAETQRAAILLALHEDPKVVDLYGNPWRHLAFVPNSDASLRALVAWLPWYPRIYQLQSERERDPDARRSLLRLANWLAPDAEEVWFAEHLLRRGAREEARGVATRTSHPGLDMHIRAADARFGAALALAKVELVEEPTRLQVREAFYTAAIATDVAHVLGKRYDASELIRRYVLGSPSFVAHHPVATRAFALYVCLHAPPAVAAACSARFEELVASAGLTDSSGFLELVRGGRVLASGDAKLAANVWRPLVREHQETSLIFRDLFVETLDRAGEGALAHELDAETIAHAGRFNGAELAFVREARRAEKAGEKERAAKLAHQVIDAWSAADEQVPAVAEMRALAARVER